MPSIDFRIDQAALSDALETVRRAVPGKASLPILETVRIAASGGAVALSATDLQIQITARVAADVAVPGEIAVPARALADWVKALSPGTVRLALATGATRVKASSGRATASLVSQATDDFPTPPTTGDAAELTLDARRLRRALGRVLPAVRGDDSHRALACVCLDPRADGLHLAAADGFRLAQAVLPEAASAPADRMLLPRRAAEEFARALGAGDVARLRVARGGNVAVLSVGRCEIAARLVEDSFPDVARLVPINSTKT
jgi:DNA polymerase-3 subunit beta